MNKKRVRFIKRLIYAFIIIVLFLPLILMSFLALRMISISQTMKEQLQTLTSAISQPAPQSSSQGGYVIEPEGQSANGENLTPQTMDGKNSEPAAGDKEPNASGAQPEAAGTPTGQSAPDSGTGGGAINDAGNNTLNPLNTGNTADSGDNGGEGNPETGEGADLSPPNYNGNPGMGC